MLKQSDAFIWMVWDFMNASAKLQVVVIAWLLEAWWTEPMNKKVWKPNTKWDLNKSCYLGGGVCLIAVASYCGPYLESQKSVWKLTKAAKDRLCFLENVIPKPFVLIKYFTLLMCCCFVGFAVYLDNIIVLPTRIFT